MADQLCALGEREREGGRESLFRRGDWHVLVLIPHKASQSSFLFASRFRDVSCKSFLPPTT